MFERGDRGKFRHIRWKGGYEFGWMCGGVEVGRWV